MAANYNQPDICIFEVIIMGLYDSASNFVNAIKSTREFNELIQSINIIEKNSSLKSGVNEFNRKFKEICSSTRSVSEIEAKVTELKRQNAGLFKIAEVERYIKASKTFDDMMLKVYKSIGESLEADLKLK